MAARFWVGGGGTWDASTTTNWAASSGGTGGASAPTTADSVTFDTLSGVGTCTLSGSPACASFDCSVSTVLTFTGTGTLTCAGNFKLEATLTISGWTGTVTLTGTGSQTFTTAGNTIAFAITKNGAAGTYQLQDDLNMGAKTLTVTQGTLDTNSKVVTCGSFSSSNSNTRGITLGTSTINCTGWSTSTIGGLTFSAASSTINVSGSSLGFSPGALTYGTVTVQMTVGQNFTLNGASGATFATLTITGPTNKTQSWSLPGNITVTGTFTINGNSAANRLLIQSDTAGTARTLTVATIVTKWTDWMDITAAGAANWDLTAQATDSSGNCGGNTGITFTVQTTQHWTNASSGSWSASGNWTSRIPLPQDTVILDKAFGTSQTVTLDMPRAGLSIDFTGATWTTALTWSVGATTVYGSVTLISGLTVTGSNVGFNFLNRSNATYTSNTVSVPWQFNVNCVGATLFTDSFTQTGSFGLNLGNSATLDVQNNNVSIDSLGITGGTPTINLGTGTWSMTGTAGFNIGSSTTINRSTSTIKYTNTSNTVTNFGGSSSSFWIVWFSRGASTGSITISGSNTFSTFKDDGTAAHSILFTAGTTQTITTFTMPNSSSAVVTINSAAGSTSTHALVKAGGGQVSCDWLNIQHSVATPAATTWYAGANSVNNQGTATAGSGWTFTTVPPQQDEFNGQISQPLNSSFPQIVSV